MKILLLALLSTTSIFAQMDLNTFVSARSYPALGGEFGAELGYGKAIWGTPSKKDFKFGFIRANLRTAISGVVNNVSAEIEFYPISIFGIEAGYQYIKSDYKGFPFFNCEKIRCRGEIHRQYISVKGALGFKNIVGLYNLQMNRNRYNNANSKPVGEFRTATIIESEDDFLYTARYVLGYKMENDMIGLVEEYHKFSNEGDFNRMSLLILSRKNGKQTYTYGLGGFESTHVAKGLILVFQYNYSVLDKINLF